MTTKIRQNGVLQETSDEELKNLAQKGGLPAAPATPAGAAAVGASPDAAKMAGSRQQKQSSVVNVDVAPRATLQGVQRAAAPRQQATGAEAAQADQATKLAGLNQLGTRVQALVNQQLAGVAQQAQAQPQWNQAQFDTLAPTVAQDGVKTLLSSYHSLNAQLQNPALTPEAKQALQAQLATAQAQLVNQYGITNPQDYLNLSTGTIASSAAAQVTNPEDVKIGTLGVEQLGVQPAELDSMLGPGWQDLSLGAFKQRVEDLRQSEFSRVNSLRAQLATLPVGSAQRELVLRELGDVAQAGVTGVEQGMQRLQQQVNSADIVKLAGREYNVETLLKDESVSQLVKDYLSGTSDPAWVAQVKAEHPELAAWIESNRDGLTALTKQMGVSGEQFSGLQDEQRKLATVAEGLTLSDAVMKAVDPNWGSAVGAVSDLSGNPVYAALTDPDLSDDERNALVQKLNGDPAQVAALANMTPDQVQQASAAADKVQADPTLGALLGVEPGAFLTDPAAQAKLAELSPLVDTLRAGGKQFETFLADEKFQALLKDGTLNAANIEAFVQNPGAYKQYTDYQQLMTEFGDIETSGSIDKALQFLFGSDQVSKKSLEQLFTELKTASTYDPTDKAAAKRLKSLTSLVGSDGKMDQTEYASLLERMKAGLEGATFDEIVAGQDLDKAGFSLRGALSKATKPTEHAVPDGVQRSFLNTLKAALADDGKVSFKELRDMPEAAREHIFAMPKEWHATYGGSGRDDYEARVSQSAASTLTKRSEADLGEIFGFNPQNFSSFLRGVATGGYSKDRVDELQNYYATQQGKASPQVLEGVRKAIADYRKLKAEQDVKKSRQERADRKRAEAEAAAEEKAKRDELIRRQNRHLQYEQNPGSKQARG